MKKTSRILKKDSKTAATSQPKTAQSRAIVRPESNSPCIALFPQGDTSASEEIIDLSKAEYAALKRAVAPSGSGILMFMANVALKKIGAAPPNPGTDHPFRTWFEMENAVYQAIGCLHLFQQAIGSKVIEETGDLCNLIAAGIYHLSNATTDRLKAAFDSIRASDSPGQDSPAAA